MVVRTCHAPRIGFKVWPGRGLALQLEELTGKGAGVAVA